jgi:hypothetical protein
MTFTASIIVEADDEAHALFIAGVADALASIPSYTLPPADPDLVEPWTVDVDEDFEADEVEPDDEVKQGDPCAECGEPIESADQIADGRPLCADHFAHWNNMTA